MDWWSLGIFMHELVYGKSPFRGSKRENTFENIVRQPVKFPDTPNNVSQHCQVRAPHPPCTAGARQHGWDERVSVSREQLGHLLTHT